MCTARRKFWNGSETEILLKNCGVFFMMMMEAAPSVFSGKSASMNDASMAFLSSIGSQCVPIVMSSMVFSASDCAPDEGCAQHSAFFPTGGVRGGEACCDEEYSASSVREPCIFGPSRAPTMSRAFFVQVLSPACHSQISTQRLKSAGETTRTASRQTEEGDIWFCF